MKVTSINEAQRSMLVEVGAGTPAEWFVELGTGTEDVKVHTVAATHRFQFNHGMHRVFRDLFAQGAAQEARYQNTRGRYVS